MVLMEPDPQPGVWQPLLKWDIACPTELAWWTSKGWENDPTAAAQAKTQLQEKQGKYKDLAKQVWSSPGV